MKYAVKSVMYIFFGLFLSSAYLRSCDSVYSKKCSSVENCMGTQVGEIVFEFMSGYNTVLSNREDLLVEQELYEKVLKPKEITSSTKVKQQNNQ